MNLQNSGTQSAGRPGLRGQLLVGVLLSFMVGTLLPAAAQQGQGGRNRGNSSANRNYPGNGTVGDAYFSIDPETKRVVTIADEATSLYISQVLSNLDRPKPQVLIKVVFMEVTHSGASDIGIEGGWGKRINNDPTDVNAVNGFGLSGLSSVMGTNLNQFGQPVSSFNAVSPMTSPGAGLYQVLGKDYQVTLRAIAQAGKAKILSRPSILARNNQPATIKVGQSVPIITSVNYTQLGNSYNSYNYRDVGVILSVTPFITADRMVEMIVQPEISSLNTAQAIPTGNGTAAPVIDIRSADTVAVTPDGQTVVIGGLMQTIKEQVDTKIPLLGDVPLIGNLFKRRQKSEVQKELVIFLTPHIVEAPGELAALSAREQSRSTVNKDMTEEELNRYLDNIPMQNPSESSIQTPPSKKKQK